MGAKKYGPTPSSKTPPPKKYGTPPPKNYGTTPPKTYGTTPPVRRPSGSTPPVKGKPTGPSGTQTKPPIKYGPGKTTFPPVTHPQITPQLNNPVKDPAFNQNIANLRPQTGGVPRNQIRVPICASSNVTDEVLYEDPTQSAKKYYLPRYAVAGDGQRYDVAFRAEAGSRWSLAISLTKSAAPVIASAANSAQELPHRVAVFLRCNQMIGNQAGAREELSFQQVTTAPGAALQATLYCASVEQRDVLYRALTDPALGATLVVRRTTAVAIPAPRMIPLAMGAAAAMMRPQQPSSPQSSVPLFSQVVRAIDQVVDPNPFVFPPDIFKDVKDVAPASSQRTELTKLEVPSADGQTHTYYQDATSSYIFYYFPDSFKIARRPDGNHEPLMSVRFGQAASADDLKGTFSFVASPYADAARLAEAADKLRSSITGSLPKGIDGPQLEPLLTAPENSRFSLAYPGSDTSQGAFENRTKAAVDMRSGIQDSLTLSLSQLQSVYDALFDASSLLLTGKVSVTLGKDSIEIPFSGRAYDLAGDLLACGEQSNQADVSDEPRSNGASDGPSMTDSVMSAIGDAVSGNVAGAVTDVIGGLASKLIHKAKKDKKNKDKKKKGKDAAEELEIRATVQNIIESPVEIQSLPATLVSGQGRFAANVQGLDTSQPVQLAPAGQIEFTVTPADEVEIEGQVHVEYDMSGVHALPDKEAIWNSILDPGSTQSYLRAITVKTPASTFSIPAGHASRRIVSLVLDFDGGTSVELNANKLEANVNLQQPVTNLVLHKDSAGEYRYKVTIIRANGEQNRDPDWRPPETTSILFPAVQQE
ncbi:MAG TPA: hypothetical protein VKE93_04150 [Candidatus Angelobacter sp.]|nr:hypothetical protein [Candidatus Angelobacter sp.]